MRQSRFQRPHPPLPFPTNHLRLRVCDALLPLRLRKNLSEARMGISRAILSYLEMEMCLTAGSIARVADESDYLATHHLVSRLNPLRN